ncbi:hypothetical protein Dsin_023039 [Dipteronia sinensis]|uniref:Uncharacterized protein n=1 Tax=Dipteronia sinensis TaxID=43782 RepID=A0AAE0A2U0_9ROSI|nr:hypothetical protein Dsin_023039 [Dipteronia sinensis]
MSPSILKIEQQLLLDLQPFHKTLEIDGGASAFFDAIDDLFLKIHSICFVLLILQQFIHIFNFFASYHPSSVVTFEPQSNLQKITDIVFIVKLVGHKRPAQERDPIAQRFDGRVPTAMAQEESNGRMFQHFSLWCPTN